MEFRQQLLLVVAVLVAAALYIALASPGVQPAIDDSAAKALLLKSAGFGKGLGDYAYSYSETFNGFKTTYTLMKSNDRRFVEIQNPLATEKVYILPNDTVLCVKYPVNETCSSIANDSRLDNYKNFVKSKFFNDTNIDAAVSGVEELVNKSRIIMDADIENTTVGAYNCSRVRYTIDYNNITMEEGARYGIGTLSPRIYHLTRCIEPESGLAYETTLEYIDKNMSNTKVTTVLSFKKITPAIEPPADLTGNAVAVLEKEKAEWLKLTACFTEKSGDEREKCVADISLDLKRKDLCELAGARKDRCLVSIVPLTKDQTICEAIGDPSFKDDCYIELAGVYKDSSYCSRVMNASKTDYCQEVAKPGQPSEESGAGEESAFGNNSTSGEGMEQFLNYIDSYGGNQTGAANDSGSANQTG